MDNMMEVLNGIESKNFTVVGPVFVNHLLRMNADERVWSKEKFLSKFDWSGVEKEDNKGGRANKRRRKKRNLP
ncbi:unnamed protein product [Cuscuta campestris]|uniref:Uncharacterized protein n=1 Tax=Cuscuta campestris TaxID=132261 RepID=A0A484L0F6_9ASTE|nr:unnamed protein product [Cuscuta campestris]